MISWMIWCQSLSIIIFSITCISNSFRINKLSDRVMILELEITSKALTEELLNAMRKKIASFHNEVSEKILKDENSKSEIH